MSKMVVTTTAGQMPGSMGGSGVGVGSIVGVGVGAGVGVGSPPFGPQPIDKTTAATAPLKKKFFIGIPLD